MHDAILRQPEAFRVSIERNAAEIQRLAGELKSRDRLFLIGMGTSHHAAQIGEHMMRVYAGGIDARAVHSFDFALYGPSITRASARVSASRDAAIVISHRGKKRYSAASLERLREAGAFSALITGENDPAALPPADAVLQTVEQEISSAHTVSYTGAVAILASLANEIGGGKSAAGAINSIPNALNECLATESQVKALAERHANHRRIWITGAGPCGVVAVETALKIKETSFLQAEGMPVETLIHGPFQCVESDDLFILLAPEGAGQSRVIEIIPLIKAVGAPYLLVHDGTAKISASDAAAAIEVPRVPEPFTGLTCLIPMQLFSYHLALAKGTNPDTFRAEDPRFAKFKDLIAL